MKNKVLFIVADFYHGGAQREMHEMDCAINKRHLEVTILCLSELNKSKCFSDYFYSKHLELNTAIHFLNNIVLPNDTSTFGRIKRKAGVDNRSKRNIQLFENFLDHFSNVFFMGEYVYKSVSRYISKDYFNQINVFIMCARFQGEHYRDFDKENKYLFVSAFDDVKQIEYEFEGFKDYKHLIFPLSFKIDLNYLKKEFSSNAIKKIGIFTRLNKAKPLDPFFYALHLLLSEREDIELHIFGSGDFKEAEYNRYINHLHLNEKVKFRGHQENIKKCCLEEHLDLIWFQGYKNRPAGYAGLDLCLTGVPILLWDFYLGDNPNANSLKYVYPHFKNLNLFVKASSEVLKDDNLAKQISKNQFSDVTSNRNMEINIKTIEEIVN